MITYNEKVIVTLVVVLIIILSTIMAVNMLITFDYRNGLAIPPLGILMFIITRIYPAEEMGKIEKVKT